MQTKTAEPLQVKIGQELRTIRKKLNLTLQEAGNKSRKPFTEISQIELGNVNFSLATLEQLAKGYNLEVVIKFKKAKK